MLTNHPNALGRGIAPGGAGSFSSLSLPTSTKTGAYTATSSDYLILCNAASAGFTVALPAAATSNGRIYVIKKIDATGNVVTIDANGTETIDGSETQTLDAQWESMEVQCNGTAWFIT